MKKSFISLGLIVAAAFTLTNCAKEFENPSHQPESAGIPFEITASTPDTKTANDGLNTVWVENDAINLFHAEAGSTTYVNDNDFIVAEADVDAGRFTGTLGEALEAGKSYDWYAFYPQSDYTTTPANTSGGRTYIGCRSDESQAQVGLDNMEHIAGVNYPLFGYAKSVSADAKPTIAMTHVSSLIEVVVTNTLSEDLSVENISFTAPEDIVGYYYINFAGEECTFEKYNTYQSNTANLTVSDAVIPAGGKGKFYLAVKPFTAERGSELTLAVNGYDGNGPLAMTKDVTFSAGKIKTLNFTYDKVVSGAEHTIEWESSSDWSENCTKIISGYYTVKTAKNSGSTEPTVNASANDCRVYAKGSVTISHSAVNIKKIVFNISENGKKRLTDITPSVGTVTVDNSSWKVIWEGDSQNVTFTVGELATYGTEGNTKAGQLCFDSIDAVAEVTDAPVIATLKNIELSGMTTEFLLGDQFEFDGVVTAYYYNQDSKVVQPTEIQVPEMTFGNHEVEITYVEGGVTAKASYNIYVDDPNAAEAESVTSKVVFANLGYSNGQAISEVEVGDVTVTFDKGSNNSNPPKYYSTGTAIRAYGGNYFTLTAPNNITKVVFAFASGEGTNAISVDVGNFDASTKTWEGKSNSVTFTIGGTSGHRRIASIEVSYEK